MFKELFHKIDSLLFGEYGAEVLHSDKYTISEERAAKILAEIPEDTTDITEESVEETAVRVEAEIGEAAEEYYGKLIESGVSVFDARIIAEDWREGKEQEYYYLHVHEGGLLSALWIAIMISV